MTTATLAPTRRIGHARCAVCQLPADVLLCRECADQPNQSKACVLTWLARNSAQAIAALERWDAVRSPQQAAWDRIQDSQANDPTYTHISKCADHVAKGDIYGKLLEAEETYKQALQPLDSERKRLEHALAVLDNL